MFFLRSAFGPCWIRALKQRFFLELHVYAKPYGFIRMAFFGNSSGIKSLFFSIFGLAFWSFLAGLCIFGFGHFLWYGIFLRFCYIANGRKSQVKKFAREIPARFLTSRRRKISRGCS